MGFWLHCEYLSLKGSPSVTYAVQIIDTHICMYMYFEFIYPVNAINENTRLRTNTKLYTPLPVNDKTRKKWVRTEENLTMCNHLHLNDIYRQYTLNYSEYTFTHILLSTHGLFIKTDHMLSYKNVIIRSEDVAQW